MKINLGYGTVGKVSFGDLKGILLHFDRLVELELATNGFKSSFEEFSLMLTYPPMYIASEIVGMEKVFMEEYQTLPYSRIDRRYRTMSFRIQAPEFSEFFDGKEEDNHKHQFQINPAYLGITDTELASILIDKFLDCGQILAKKLKKEDVFDLQKFNQILTKLKSKISNELLEDSSSENRKKISEANLERAEELREKRKKFKKKPNKIIQDFRVYEEGNLKGVLYPYSSQYAEIFLNLLRKNKFMCPDYHHLYIKVAESYEKALKESVNYEDWYINGIAVFDYKKYLNANEHEKQAMVFDLIVEGLMDIVDHDGLDKSIVEKVITEIKEKGLDTELTFRIIENKKFVLTVTYFARSNEEENPVFFSVKEIETGKSNKIQIGSANNVQLYPWLQKITITAEQIKVKSSVSAKANVWLKDKPRQLEFKISDMLKN
jgi:hypothetical protein